MCAATKLVQEDVGQFVTVIVESQDSDPSVQAGFVELKLSQKATPSV